MTISSRPACWSRPPPVSLSVLRRSWRNSTNRAPSNSLADSSTSMAPRTGSRSPRATTGTPRHGAALPWIAGSRSPSELFPPPSRETLCRSAGGSHSDSVERAFTHPAPWREAWLPRPAASAPRLKKAPACARRSNRMPSASSPASNSPMPTIRRRAGRKHAGAIRRSSSARSAAGEASHPSGGRMSRHAPTSALSMAAR